MNFLRVLLIVLGLLVQMPLTAQRFKPLVCATPDLTESERSGLSSQAVFALRTKRAAGAQSAIAYVPIRPHIIRRSNGTDGMALDKLNTIIAIANSYYLQNGSGIQFYFCGTTPDYINNDALFNSFPAFNESSINGRDAANALNQYYVNAFDTNTLGGYAYFPSADTRQSTRSFILNGDEADLGNRLIPHELGHSFGLLHTFGSTNNNKELVTRGVGANCTTEGDELCDTPADPYGLPNATTTISNGCEVYNGTAVDAQGNPYMPSMTNIMSYYFPCTHDFTPGQYSRMQAGLALRQTHTSYTLDCPPTAVAAPSNLAANIVSGRVRLTWRDNGTNEMGYFVERSLNATSGFVPIGGVGPNDTTFVDSKAASYTVYYYRVKPSNATTSGISPVVTIRTPACRPNYSSIACTDSDGLNGFSINNTVVSQRSGCSPDGYNSIPTSATVAAGRSYSFTATLLSPVYEEGMSIWVDLNHNGLFETDRNELLFQTPATVKGSVSGQLTLPATLTAGPLTMRIIVAYNQIPADPCGFYSYGETEDYVLNVVSKSVADLSLYMRTSDRLPALHEPVSYSLTVYNEGPNDATGIRWQNRLPAGLSFVGGGPGIMGSATAVTGASSLSLATGQSITFSYQLRPTQPGTYLNAAQIIASDQPDPDSRPDSGTGDGEDDSAMADIRTQVGGGLLLISPNPNQISLPPVASNQPPPDPAKADLSLSMVASKRVATLHELVSFTITVTNTGGLSASAVVRDTLRGMTLQSTPSGMSVVSTTAGYSILEGTIAPLAARQSAQLVFTASIATMGPIRNSAQIWSASAADPDSVPGAGTPTANNLNGEDDVAWVDLRVPM
ncbi:GEVED domain-containing protein [Spirosoma fluminis]